MSERKIVETRKWVGDCYEFHLSRSIGEFCMTLECVRDVYEQSNSLNAIRARKIVVVCAAHVKLKF